MNILVRADSSSSIGTGHIMRDLVLVKQYSNENIVFATQNLDGNINNKIIETGYRIEILKSNDFEELDNIIKKLNIDMIIIDNYDIDYNFEKKLKNLNPNLKIFVLDDTYEKHFCDILLNHNIYANKKEYKKKVQKNCELRCGVKYILLRDEFIELKKQKSFIKKQKNKKTIFLGMGGADHKNLNLKILKVIGKFKKDLQVNLVTTTANKNLEELKEYCKGKKWINLQINSNEIAKLVIQSDFAIVTPSVTANEIFYLNLPMIVIKTAKNQRQMYKYLKKKRYFAMKKFDKKLLKKSIIKFSGD